VKTISLLAVLLATLALARPAAANFGPQQGGWNGEPTGLENLVITRETLTIDLRAANVRRWDELRTDRWREYPLATVEVNYRVRNDGNDRTVDLVFASAFPFDEPGDVKVWLNDQLQAPKGTSGEDGRWPVPKTMLAPGMTHRIEYYAFRNDPQLFHVQVTFPRGYSTLRAHYRTPIGANRERANPTCFWQYAYLLAPARAWAGFGGLDVTVLIPPDWPVATEPELKREGDRLIGSFDSIPDDALTITTQMPAAPFLHKQAVYRWIKYAAVVPLFALCLWLSYRITRSPARYLAHQGQPLAAIGCRLFLAGLIWGIAALALAWCWTYGEIFAIGLPQIQTNSSVFFVAAMQFFLLGIPVAVVAIPVGMGIAWKVAVRVHLQTGRQGELQMRRADGTIQ
jgi:hypothetical protein